MKQGPKLVTVVLPSIYGPYTEQCLASMAESSEVAPMVELVVVRNKPMGPNLGVAGSWNEGIAALRRNDSDWLVLLSAGVRFERAGLADFVRTLLDPPDLPHGIPVIEGDGGLGWHLIAFHRVVLDVAGDFDEVFWPAYHEDNDYSRRIQIAYGIDANDPGFRGPLWPKVPVAAHLVETAHGIQRGHVVVDFVAMQRAFIEKWGGESGAEVYRTPYNDPALTIRDVTRRPRP